uniref:ORF101 n=1 Tax=Spodoptera frugiperda granulovirus TaxID=307454 RepID=A0A346QW21_9BBAC|nr:ORF101 [Spodoptera frugiperda granulovirus]
MNGYNYVPDGAHRHQELEKVQKEIMQQHKYLESQINSLRANMKAYCGTPTCNAINDVAAVTRVNYNTNLDVSPYRKPFTTIYNNPPAAIVPAAVPLYQPDHRTPYNYKQFNTNYYKRPSQYVFK